MSIKERVEKVWAKLGNVGKFFVRYADEASDIADALRAILTAIPLNNADRDKVKRVIDKLDSVADGVVEFLEKDPKAPEPVAVKASDVKKAIDAYFKTDDGKAAIAEAVAASNSASNE